MLPSDVQPATVQEHARDHPEDRLAEVVRPHSIAAVIVRGHGAPGVEESFQACDRRRRHVEQSSPGDTTKQAAISG